MQSVTPMKNIKSSALILASALLGTGSLGWAQNNSTRSEKDLKYSAACGSSDQNAVISFVGDILIHEDLYKSVMKGSKSFSQLWKKTEALTRQADFSVGNLEGPTAIGLNRRGQMVGDVGHVYDGTVFSGTNFSFNFHPRILQDLKQTGYDLLTVANNHSLDRGFLGVDQTIDEARAVGLPTVGTRKSTERNAEFYHISEIKGLKVAFLGCTEMTNGHDDKKDQILWCYKQADKVTETIKELAARADVDAIVVMPHWGQEYEPLPNDRQKKFAKMYLEAGATAVIGSHPHVLQPWEKYITRDGRETLVAYSLGNFMAYQASLQKKTAAMIFLSLTKASQGKAKISGVAYAPTYRDGMETSALSSRANKNVLEHAAASLGVANRLDLDQTVSAQICGTSAAIR